MKKFLFAVLICFISSMPAFSAVIEHNYCAQSLGMICLGVEDFRDLIGWNNAEGKVAFDAVKLITDCVNEKFGFVLSRDLEHAGLFLVPDSASKGVGVIGFLMGNFDSKKTLKMAKESIYATYGVYPTEEELTINGKKIPSLVANSMRVLYMKDDLMLICLDSMANSVINGEMTFSEAPAFMKELLKHSDSFLYLGGIVANLVSRLPNIPEQINAIKNCNAISFYRKGSLINAEISFLDNNAANQMKSQLDAYKNKYVEDNKKLYEDAKAKIKDSDEKSLPLAAKQLFSAAKSLDYMNELKLASDNNSVIVTAPFEISGMTAIATVGVLSAMAIPNFKAARDSARAKACYSNIRVMLGAVEMYNMDHEEMMTSLDIETLVKERYLKAVPTKPEVNCDYFSDGDLTTDGQIKCRVHGGIPGYGK